MPHTAAPRAMAAHRLGTRVPAARQPAWAPSAALTSRAASPAPPAPRVPCACPLRVPFSCCAPWPNMATSTVPLA
eukprot:72341-Prymnesium_polylepis.1